MKFGLSSILTVGFPKRTQYKIGHFRYPIILSCFNISKIKLKIRSLQTHKLSTLMSTATAKQRRRQRKRPLPPLDAPDLETKATAGALLPQSAADATLRVEALCAIAVFILAFTVRLFRISQPAGIVFDEVHFLRFVKNYRDGEYLFDIHPPLGKLILLVVSKLFCRAPVENLIKIGTRFPVNYDYVPLRVSSAVFGAGVAPITLFIARTLGLAMPAAILPAVAIALDNLAIVESRIVVMDAQLMFFMTLALLAALRLFGAPMHSIARKRWLAATAVAATAAVSVKWTAAVTPFLIAVVSLNGAPFMRRPLRMVEIVAAGSAAAVIYTALFAVHFSLLPKSGRGDAFMSVEFQKSLRNNSRYEEGYRGPGFARNFLFLNARMFTSNRGIKKRHHWESKWYQWIINQRGLLYFRERFDGKFAIIYLIVNPAVGFAALTAVIVTIFIMLAVYLPSRYRKRLEPYSKFHGFAARSVFLLTGYLLNLVPYLGTFRSPSIDCSNVP